MTRARRARVWGSAAPVSTIFALALPAFAAAHADEPTRRVDFTRYVDPFLGTTNDGQSFPGAARPFGMIQWSLDSSLRESNQYDYSCLNFTGVSFTHYTGYGPRIGVLLPVVGAVRTSPAAPGTRTIGNTTTVSPYETTFRHEDENARPGYYRVRSKTGIDVELSVTDRAGVGRISWPRSREPASLILDLGNSPASGDRPIYNQVSIDASGHRLRGFAGKRDYRLYFVIEFDRPFSDVATFDGPRLQTGQTTSAIGSDVGAVVTFPAASRVTMRVGLSYVSLSKAEKNLAAEIPPGTTLEQVSARAMARWNEVLGRVAVDPKTTSPGALRRFYTHLYEMTLQPNVVSDVDGEYWGADDQRHEVAAGHAAYSGLSAWDQGRGAWASMAWLFPSLMSDVAQSYVSVAQQRRDKQPAGFIFPFLESGSSPGFGGGPEYALPAQVYAFGARGFDAAAALETLMKVSGSNAIRGGGQDDYLAGRASPESQLTFSTTDFAVATFARAIGNSKIAQALAGRAGKWRDTFDSHALDNGWTGYQWFKDASGAFEPFETSIDGTGSSTRNRFLESCSAESSYAVPQDVKGLVAAMGGDETFLRRYDVFFSRFSHIGGNFDDLATRSACRFFNSANEPDLVAPWLANWAGGPSHVQSAVRRILATEFKDGPAGLPGNNDWGALSAWYVAAAIGLYPVIPGVGGFSVNTPTFEKVTITFENGHKLFIHATSDPASHPFISALAINGASWPSTWIPLGVINTGAPLDTLDFSLASRPSSWGVTPSAATSPPSFGDR